MWALKAGLFSVGQRSPAASMSLSHRCARLSAGLESARQGRDIHAKHGCGIDVHTFAHAGPAALASGDRAAFRLRALSAASHAGTAAR